MVKQQHTDLQMVSWQLLMHGGSKFSPFWPKFLHEKRQPLDSFNLAVLRASFVAVKAHIRLVPGFAVYCTVWDGPFGTTVVKERIQTWSDIVAHGL